MATNQKYVHSKIACEKLGICNRTLVAWAKKGKIDSIQVDGGWRKYNLEKFLKKDDMIIRRKICYARVSSYDQKKHLSNQVAYLTEKYPDYELIKDIGSGINFKRTGLLQLIELAMKGEIEEVVVTYKDRLCRIGYDMVEFILEKYSNAKITVINDGFIRPEEEVVKDLIEVITVYSAKLHGMRSYKKDKKEEENEEKEEKISKIV